MKTTGYVQLHIAPLISIGINGGQQPFKTTVAFNGHDDATRFATSKALQIQFRLVQSWQHFIRQFQQPITGAGKSHGPSFAQKQRAAQSPLQFLDLVREGGLSQKHALGGFNQAPGFP